jgi:hypothetical protein
MAPPVDVVGPRPRLGDVEAPPRSRSSPSSVAVVESEPLGRARQRPLAEARAESEPWGRAKRSPCGHFGSVDWRMRVRIKVSGHLCIKCSCDLVGWRGDLVRVASWRRQGLGRAGSMFVAGGGPRARRRSSEVGCPCPRLGSGEA